MPPNSYAFTRLIGSVYTRGRLLYTSTGHSLLSPIGNRVTEFNLKNHTSRTLDFQARSDIVSMTLTNDDRLLLVVDESNHGMLVNFNRGIVLHRFAFKKKVRSIKFSPSNKYFAVSTGSHVQVWITPSLRREFSPFILHRTYTGLHDDVVAIEWSKDSRFFIASSNDNTARIFSLHPISGFTPTTLAAHRGPLVGSFFGGEGNAFTVSSDGAVVTWIWEEGDMLAPDSTLTTTEPRKMIDGSWKMKTRHFFNQEGTKVTTCSMDAAGSLLVVGFSSGVFGLYEMPGCNNIHTLSVSNHRIESVAMNPNGDWLAFGCPDLGQLLVWEWQSETYILKQQGHSYSMNTMAYSPDSQYIVTGGEDGKVKLWNSSSGFCFVTFTEHTAPVKKVIFANESVVLSASLDGTVRAHDLVRYKNFKTLTTPEPTQFVSLACDSSGELVAAGSLDPFEIYLWSLQTGKILDVLNGHKAPVTSLEFSPIGGTLASGSWDGTVKLWDCYKNDVMETLTHVSDVLCLAYRPDGKSVVCGTLSGHLHFWSTEDGKLTGTIEGQRDIAGGRKENDRQTAENNSASRHFTSVVYSADGSTVLAGGNSKWICIYSVASKILLKKFQISYSRSLDGTQEKLNSKYMTAGGGISEIATEEDFDNSNNVMLPGARRQDDGTRKTKREVLASAVQFSSTGRDFATVTTEGLLIYSLDDDMVFDPIALTEDVTPSAVASAVTKGKWGEGLIMALLLNETDLIASVCDNVPVGMIELVLRGIGREHFERLLNFVAERISGSPHVEFYLEWLLGFCKVHAVELEKNKSKYMRAMRGLSKVVSSRSKDLKEASNSNCYTIAFLLKELGKKVEKAEEKEAMIVS